MKVYVVYRHFGYEGCSEPLFVFASQQAAEKFIASRTTTRFYEWIELELEE